MPHEQYQDCADDCSHESTHETEHRNVQDAREHSTHEGSGDADQDIGENAVVGLGDLFCDPSGNCPDHQHRQKADTWVAEQCLRVFHRTLPATVIVDWTSPGGLVAD